MSARMSAGGSESVAILGTGTMGFPMARNAASAGLRVRAWNRSLEKAKPLAEVGVAIAATPAEAVKGVDIVVTMLTDAEPVLDIAERSGAFDAVAPGTVWAQMSTIGIDGIERCADIARPREIALVDAPVLGSKQPAEAGELTVLASGPADAVERCGPFFDAVASKVVRLGEAGQGTRLKLVVNSWIVTLVESLAETIVLAEALGLDPRLFLEAIAGGPLDLAYAQAKGKAMIERDFPASFKLSLALKDARLVREAAAKAGLELPVVEAVERHFAKAVAQGHGDEDLAAAYWASTPRPG
jgi:3-hydroxyisobutyrate dehydrogenase